MKSFESSDGQFSTNASIVVAQSSHPEDASNNRVFVAVAVKATREEELVFFKAMIDAKVTIGADPKRELRFFHRNNKGTFDSHQPEFYVELLRILKQCIPDFEDHIRAIKYDVSQSGEIGEQKVRAIQTALLASDLYDEGNSVVVDHGGASTAVHVYRSLQSIELGAPMTNCNQLDSYYPTALLATLLSHRLAKIEYEGSESLAMTLVNGPEHEKWGEARSGFHSDTAYTPIDMETLCGKYPRDRIVTWFEGKFCPESSGTFERVSPDQRRDVIESVRDRYPTVAEVLESISQG